MGPPMRGPAGRVCEASPQQYARAGERHGQTHPRAYSAAGRLQLVRQLGDRLQQRRCDACGWQAGAYAASSAILGSGRWGECRNSVQQVLASRCGRGSGAGRSCTASTGSPRCLLANQPRKSPQHVVSNEGKRRSSLQAGAHGINAAQQLGYIDVAIRRQGCRHCTGQAGAELGNDGGLMHFAVRSGAAMRRRCGARDRAKLVAGAAIPAGDGSG